MKEFSAYCLFCKKTGPAKTKTIEKLASGNYLYTGECLICYYEMKRIVRDK